MSDSGGGADASTQTLPITITGAAVAAPSAAIVSPADHQTYTVGESVATSFTCTEAAGGPGIASCTDSGGGASPGRLDTTTPGPQRYTVSAVSLDGERAGATIEYTVASSGGNGSGGGGGNPSGDGSTTSRGAKPAATPTTAQKLGRAIKACRKLKKSKRARCIAAAKRHFAPGKQRHRTAKA